MCSAPSNAVPISQAHHAARSWASKMQIVTFKKTKGHQDEKKPEKELTRAESINKLADKQATPARQETSAGTMKKPEKARHFNESMMSFGNARRDSKW